MVVLLWSGKGAAGTERRDAHAKARCPSACSLTPVGEASVAARSDQRGNMRIQVVTPSMVFVGLPAFMITHVCFPSSDLVAVDVRPDRNLEHNHMSG